MCVSTLEVCLIVSAGLELSPARGNVFGAARENAIYKNGYGREASVRFSFAMPSR